jgi:hypothetical protein
MVEIAMDIHEPAPPDRSEGRRRSLLLRLAAIRETREVDLVCRPALRSDFGMGEGEIEAAVKRVLDAL